MVYDDHLYILALLRTGLLQCDSGRQYLTFVNIHDNELFTIQNRQKAFRFSENTIILFSSAYTKIKRETR